jgi:COX assembly protein 2
MHPPLDRSHPDCGDVILALRACHDDTWKKYTGGCNMIKVALDQCFKLEKDRLLKEMNKELPGKRDKQEEIIKKAFGKEMTFREYLQKDKEYQAELQNKKERGQQL